MNSSITFSLLVSPEVEDGLAADRGPRRPPRHHMQRGLPGRGRVPGTNQDRGPKDGRLSAG